jgi:enterochelin esterase family protein
MFKTFSVVLLLSLAVSVNHLGAQPPERPPQFKSLEVSDDKRVDLRLWAPNAKSVRLSIGDLPGQTAGGRELNQREDRVWEISLDKVPPGTYRYNFSVDGLAVIDPRNPSTSESNSNTWSLLTVPGSVVSDWTDVPHGAVASWTYHSKTLGRARRVHVYTPPGYETSSLSYPVLYLLHGATDCDNSWSTVGRAGLVLDNLIAAGQAKPMVVVMPMGHTGAFEFGRRDADIQKQMSDFERDFAEDLRPAVETRYRLLKARQHRAIAGLSMGGAQTLSIAANNLAEYGYIGVFSSGVFGIAGGGPGNGQPSKQWEEQHAQSLGNAELKQGLKLIWFATGTEDFLLNTTRETVRMLKSHGFDVVYEETDGGHTWIKWREHYLPAFAKQLFQ